MNIGVYQSAASLSALERWQDAVTQNITASQVSGYKKRTVEFTGLDLGQISADPKGKTDSQPATFPKANYGINFQSGESTPTGRDLDVSLEGEGFFQVQLQDGSRGYTRAGSLHVRTDRTLTDGSDNAILSESGSPMTLGTEGGDVTIASDGSIRQGANQVGKLGVVKFANTSQLSPDRRGVFKVPEGVQGTPVEQPQIMQGHLEGSNVTPLREMVALVQIARMYEANQKVITSRDQTGQKVLDTLG